MFPIMLNIHGRKCTVAGGGNVAERKVKTLLKYGADVTAVSPVFKDRFPNVKPTKRIRTKEIPIVSFIELSYKHNTTTIFEKPALTPGTPRFNGSTDSI